MEPQSLFVGLPVQHILLFIQKTLCLVDLVTLSYLSVTRSVEL